MLDLGGGIAGAFCSRVLARLGADVIKVEPVGTGDFTRRWGGHKPGVARGEGGALHLYVDEGKRSVTLNPFVASGRSLMLRLFDHADVVVENYEPSLLDQLDLHTNDLRETRPRLVFASISSYGRTGPYKHFKGREVTVFATGGHTYRTGHLGRPPVRMGGHPSQYLGALQAAYAVLLAVRAAELQGVGQDVEFSTFENQVTSHAQAMVEVAYYGAETGADLPRGSGEARRLMASDGPVMFSIMDQQLPALVELVGAPSEFGQRDPSRRPGASLEFQNYVKEWVRSKTQREVYELGQAAKVPTSYSASPADLLASPQYRWRQFFLKTDHPEAGTVEIPGMPFKWSGSDADPLPAPLLGQHNEEVYCGLLGLSLAELTRLYGSGVI